MIVRTLEEGMSSDRRVTTNNWESTRLILQDDGMGYSFHITTIYAGTATEMEYRNHLETVYCLQGEGEITSLADGKTFPITPGTVYALDQHDRHILRAATEMKMACVFNPPLIGGEVHDETGAYPLDDSRGQKK